MDGCIFQDLLNIRFDTDRKAALKLELGKRSRQAEDILHNRGYKYFHLIFERSLFKNRHLYSIICLQEHLFSEEKEKDKVCLVLIM